MNPKQITELVEVTYWECTVEAHRHKTVEVALACIAKHSVPKEARRKWTPDMMCDAFASVLNGASWREAGEGYGVSTERIRQVVSKAVRMMRHPARLDEEYPDHSDGIEGWRSEKEFWMRRIAKFRNKQPNA